MSCCIVFTNRQTWWWKGSSHYKLNSLLSESSSLDIIDNSNIGHSFLGMHGLHLNEHGVRKLALNFVDRIRSIFISGSAKQKVKEVHSKISNFWLSSDNTRSDKPETIYAFSHNLNEKTMKYWKGIQEESQKCKKFTDFLFNIRKHHFNNIIMAQININFHRNKFDMLINLIRIHRYTNDFWN